MVASYNALRDFKHYDVFVHALNSSPHQQILFHTICPIVSRFLVQPTFPLISLNRASYVLPATSFLFKTCPFSYTFLDSFITDNIRYDFYTLPAPNYPI